MLLFQWNGLRVGDDVIVHDDDDLTEALHRGRVHAVQAGLGTAGNDVGIRLAGGSTIRPRRSAVHTTLSGSRDCWRCHLLSAHSAAGERARLGVPDGDVS